MSFNNLIENGPRLGAACSQRTKCKWLLNLREDAQPTHYKEMQMKPKEVIFSYQTDRSESLVR